MSVIGRLTCQLLHPWAMLADGGRTVRVCPRCEPVRYARLDAARPTFARLAADLTRASQHAQSA